MNKIERGALYGLSLGDGCITLSKGAKNHSILIGHGPKQEEYITHKAKKLQSIFGGKELKVRFYQVYNKRTEKSYTNLQISATNPYLNQIHRNLYPTGVKTITRKVLDFLTDEGLAYWYMDDGAGDICKNKNGKICGCMIRISTYCTKEEALEIQSWFKDKYELNCVFDIDKRNNKYSVRFNTKDSIKFANLIKPFILPCMEYKISSVIDYVPRVQSTLPEKSGGEDIV